NDEHDDISRLYRQSRIEEPPMRLDSAILREARHSVEPKPGFRLRAWLLPIASTAVVLLAVTVVIQMQQQPKIMAPEPARNFEAPAPAAGAVTREKEVARPAAKAEMKARSQLNESMPASPEQQRAADTLSADKAARVAAPAESAAAAAPQPPLEWLAEIRKMQQAGRLREAAESLKAFRLRYPDYTIPDDLKPLQSSDPQ
ncbi:MAG TPA: hypothetical protein VNI58_01635, partial [Mariprofundaceae bacterium]|nr:hypothetical protein [Mariprofundaceae bacterium]